MKRFTIATLLVVLSACGSKQSPDAADVKEEPTTQAESAGHHCKHKGEHGKHDGESCSKHGEGHGKHAAHGAKDGEGPHKHGFDNPEEWAKKWNTPERAAWQKPDEVVGLMSITAGMAVADIGAGTGYFLPYLSAAVGEKGTVHAIDVEDAMITYLGEQKIAQKWDNLTVHKGKFESPDLPDGSLDRVLTVNTWHHFADRPAYATAVYKTLKPGGKLIIVDFTQEKGDWHGPPMKMRLSPEQVIEDLTKGGFKAERVEETLPRQYIVIGSK